MVNLIVAITLRDHNQDPILRMTKLQYEDYQHQVVKKLGIPSFKTLDKWHYSYNGQDNLIIDWKDGRLIYARADFSDPIPFYRLEVSDRVVILESNKNRVKIGIPEQGQRFEVDSLGAVVSLEVGAPWNSNKTSKKLSTILIETGFVPHMAMGENSNKAAR